MARRYCPAGPQKKNRAGRQSLAQIDCNLSNLNPPVGFTEIWSGCRAGPVLPLTPIIATIDRPLRGAIGVPRWFYLSHRIEHSGITATLVPSAPMPAGPKRVEVGRA